jgi:hypothetical protein
MKKTRLALGLVILLMLLFGENNASAVSVTLYWDAPTTNEDGSPLTDLAGYRVYYGLASRNYSHFIDVGNVNAYTINNLTGGLIYYFAVTAYDFSGNESKYSNEAAKQLDPDITFEVVQYYCDTDGDGYITDVVSGVCNTPGCVPAGCLLTPGTDCNDNNASVYSGANDSNCDGVDNDCDGVPDDDYVVTATSCGQGVCASNGQLQCLSGVEVDTCVAGSPTGADDNCNGIDEDCDGVVDGNYTGGGTCVGYANFLLIPDLNGNGSQEVAALYNDPTTGQPSVVLVDSATELVIKRVLYFHGNAVGRRLAAFGDLNGNGAEEIAVLADDYNIGQTNIEIRDALTGGLFPSASTAVDAPVGLAVQSASANQIVFSWDAVFGADKYNIYRDGVFIGESVSLSYIDNTVNTGTCYVYTVEAVSGAITSALSAEISIATTGGTCGTNNNAAVYKNVVFYAEDGSGKFAVAGVSSNQPRVYIINAQTGLLEQSIAYFSAGYSPLAVEQYSVNGSALIGVLAEDGAGGIAVEIRYASDGTLYQAF